MYVHYNLCHRGSKLNARESAEVEAEARYKWWAHYGKFQALYSIGTSSWDKNAPQENIFLERELVT